MIKNKIERLPTAVAVLLTVLVVAACAIRLRGDESETQSPPSLALKSDPMAEKLEQCRTVKTDQKDALLECRKIWAEKRRQFLGQKNAVTRLGSEPGNAGSSPVLPKDESRLPSTSPTIPQQSE